MLQAINNQHDLAQANSLSELAAARHDGKKHLLLGCSGSVATIKLPEILKALSSYSDRLSIRIVLTEPAKQFLAGQSGEQPTVASLARLPCVDAVYDDSCEWGPEPWVRGTDVLHISLRRWADLMVVAPMSANTLAAVVAGMSSSLLLSCIRAWDTDGSVDGVRKRIIVAVAMNTAMWRHPVGKWGFLEVISSAKPRLWWLFLFRDLGDEPLTLGF